MAAPLGRAAAFSSGKSCSHQRICQNLPRHLVLARNQRSGGFSCHGLTLPQALHWPFADLVDWLLKRRNEAEVAPLEAEHAHLQTAERGERSLAIKSSVLDATANALHAGLRLTGVVLRLAKIVVDDLRRTLTAASLHKISNDEEASALMRAAQAQLLEKAKREALETQGKDKAFMQMLHCLDRCHMNFDEKWGLFTKHSADKTEFSKRWQGLYQLAMGSKSAVDTLLRPDASRHEINQFWRSAETSAIIAEEDALKKLVFAQVFQAGQS